MRENRGEIEAAEKTKSPNSWRRRTSRGCFHNHTTESDGDNTFGGNGGGRAKKRVGSGSVGDHSHIAEQSPAAWSPAALFKKMRDIQELNQNA